MDVWPNLNWVAPGPLSNKAPRVESNPDVNTCKKDPARLSPIKSFWIVRVRRLIWHRLETKIQSYQWRRTKSEKYFVLLSLKNVVLLERFYNYIIPDRYKIRYVCSYDGKFRYAQTVLTREDVNECIKKAFDWCINMKFKNDKERDLEFMIYDFSVLPKTVSLTRRGPLAKFGKFLCLKIDYSVQE